MNYPETDLSNCDKEPIHIPGRIQSHGFLVAIDENTNEIVYISDNLESYTGLPGKDLAGQSLKQLLSALNLNDNDLDGVIRYAARQSQDNLIPVVVQVGGRDFHLIIHISGKYIILEFEPVLADNVQDIQLLMGSLLSNFGHGDTVQHTLEKATAQIRELIGYDRVMIYKFWEDEHGEVVAENKDENVDSFFGLHYPASDIPKQARQLYKANLTRIIADVDSAPSLIHPLRSTEAEKPLDLTKSELRAVSPIHIEYLKNMGVKASFSVSLVINDELWGLIACHHYSPKLIDYRSRQYARLVGQILSSTLQYKISQDEKAVNLTYRAAAEEIIRDMHKHWSLSDAVTNNKNNLLKLTNAKAAAFVFEGKTYISGHAPNPEEIAGIIKWLQDTNRKNLFYTHHLSSVFEPAAQYTQKASGLLACTISRELNEYILFFKPELITTVKWAGDPAKPVETGANGKTVISPRRSFEVWAEEVRGKSEKWTNAEINEVFRFREEIVQFINLKANEIRKLNEKLKEAYDELDTFSFTISHDLKTPIASIKNYSEILLEDFEAMNEQAKHFLNRIINSADKMNALIREVLNYSRLSRKELRKSNLVMRPVLDDIVEEVRAAYQPANLKVSIGDTPDIYGDSFMTGQVFTNLIGNAVKYSAKSNPAIVKIEGRDEGDSVLYTVSDNGVGIDMEYGSHIFELFKRMENAREFEGSGVGLAIVKRIMEKHNARIWYDSVKGNGTIFYLSFQKEGHERGGYSVH